AGVIEPGSIVINAASGVSGAGRQPKQHLHFPGANENYSAYGIGTHRHQPEIGQSLRVFGQGSAGTAPDPLFVAHLLPIERGILETIYATPAAADETTDRVNGILGDTYAGDPFVAVREEAPTLRDVQRTNMVHVNGRVVGGRVVLIAAIDNLVKGASGQAV